MRAVEFESTGDPEVLHVADVPEPHAGPGEVRIAVRAAAVNPIDFKFRAGMIEVPLPSVPGFDAAGVVDEVGEGADAQVGDAVFGHAGGRAYAEYAVLEAWATKPERASFEEAAGWVMASETATRSLDAVGVGDGDTVVIAGAAGGVGAAAVQIAVARGARVIGTASEANHDFLRSLGAEPVTYGEGQLDRIRALTDRADAGFDTAGKGAVKDLIELTGDPAKVVSIADFGAADLGAQLSTQSSAWQAFPAVAALYEEGRFTLPVAETFSFEDAAAAHRRAEQGHGRGKLILVP